MHICFFPLVLFAYDGGHLELWLKGVTSECTCGVSSNSEEASESTNASTVRSLLIFAPEGK